MEKTEEEFKKELDKDILDMFNPHKQNKYRRAYKYVKTINNFIESVEKDTGEETK